MSHQNGNGYTNGNAIDLSRSIDRRPPQSLDIERGLLGCVLLEGRTLLDEIAPTLSADDFYRDAHRTIYRAMLALYATGKPVDTLSVPEHLESAGEYERVGGDPFLGDLVQTATVGVNAVYYAAVIREKAIKRAIIEAAGGLLRDAYADELPAAEVLQRAERLIFDLSTHQTTGRIRSLAEILPEVMAAIQRRRAGEVSGISSGFPDLDFATGGFHPGQLVVLAARPSHGKSALAWAFAEHASVVLRVPSLFASLEMTGESLVERALSARSMIDGHKIRTGYALLPRDFLELESAVADLTPAPIYVDDTPAQTMLHAASTARRLKLRRGLGLVVFDYAQLGESDAGDSRQEQVAAISRRLKAMARELEVPVIALSQLNRECEKRPDHQPLLSDLRESGAIEQDADIVMLLNRPERYDPDDQPGIAIVDVAKNRNGATGRVKLCFQKAYVRFDSLANVAEPIDAGDF